MEDLHLQCTNYYLCFYCNKFCRKEYRQLKPHQPLVNNIFALGYCHILKPIVEKFIYSQHLFVVMI